MSGQLGQQDTAGIDFTFDEKKETLEEVLSSQKGEEIPHFFRISSPFYLRRRKICTRTISNKRADRLYPRKLIQGSPNHFGML